MRIRTQLFTLMRIRILFLIRVIGICDQWFIDSRGAPFLASRPPLWATALTALFSSLIRIPADHYGSGSATLTMPHPWISYTAEMFAALFSLLAKDLVTAKSINISTEFRKMIYIVHFYTKSVHFYTKSSGSVQCCLFQLKICYSVSFARI